MGGEAVCGITDESRLSMRQLKHGPLTVDTDLCHATGICNLDAYSTTSDDPQLCHSSLWQVWGVGEYVHCAGKSCVDL